MQNSYFSEIDLKLIEKLCFNFLWNKKSDKIRAYERISREKLKSDPDSGGINAPDVYSMYKALSLRQVLRSNSTWCLHGINSLQCDLIGLTPEMIFQRPKLVNPFLRNTLSTLSEIGEVYINEILNANDNALISKHYYNIIVSENLIALLHKLFDRSMLTHFAICLKKFLGIVCVGHLINEYKFPSTDKLRYMVANIISSHKIFNVLAARKELQYGCSFRDFFLINTNNLVNCDKVTTKTLRMLLYKNNVCNVKTADFSIIKRIIHPREKEIVLFELHNVLLSNKKLYDMKLRDSPLCEMCQCEQDSEHIFKSCSNAVTSLKVYNELLPQIMSLNHSILQDLVIGSPRMNTRESKS
jgi:hypothetical protein